MGDGINMGDASIGGDAVGGDKHVHGNEIHAPNAQTVYVVQSTPARHVPVAASNVNPVSQTRKIFLSSTFTDLQGHRKRVIEAIDRLRCS